MTLPMNSTKIIEVYESIQALTRNMLQAALDSNWDELAALEIKCRAMIERLIAAEPHDPLNPAQQQRKIEIIRQVLEDDAAIRNLTEPWLAQLQHFLGSATQEQRLHQAYGDNGA